MKVILSPKEKERFQKLTEPEKQLFLQEKADRLEKLSIKTAILTTLLIESLDDIEMYNLFRHRLKKTSKIFKAECEAYVDDLFRSENLEESKGQRTNTADYIVHASKAVDEEIEKTLTLLTQ